MPEMTICRECDGAGRVICERCNGKGRALELTLEELREQKKRLEAELAEAEQRLAEIKANVS
jgi:predicted  nucleic acid-binding Zn-ribbon protein